MTLRRGGALHEAAGWRATMKEKNVADLVDCELAGSSYSHTAHAAWGAAQCIHPP